MFLDSRVTLLCDKFDKAVEVLLKSSSTETLESLESLSEELRSIMAKTDVECYDTLHEIDSLCYEAERRNDINYSLEVSKIKGLYKEEVGL